MRRLPFPTILLPLRNGALNLVQSERDTVRSALRGCTPYQVAFIDGQRRISGSDIRGDRHVPSIFARYRILEALWGLGIPLFVVQGARHSESLWSAAALHHRMRRDGHVAYGAFLADMRTRYDAGSQVAEDLATIPVWSTVPIDEWPICRVTAGVQAVGC